jgi:four helix bundle protein
VSYERSGLKSFTELEVWQKAHRLFLDITVDVEKYPSTRAAKVISDQILRSSGSISANISEGFNAASTKEYVHYLDIARRSTAETENWLYKIRDLNYLDHLVSETRINNCTDISKMICGLRKSLKSKIQQNKALNPTIKSQVP